MNAIAAIGRIFFAIAIAGFGIQHLILKGVVVGVELTPPWPPSHLVWGLIVGAVMVLCGLCIALNRLAVPACYLLTALFVNALVLLDLPRIMTKMMDLTERTRFFETLAFAAGALIVAGVAAKGGRISAVWRAIQILALIGTWLFAISMIVFGISHFLVPSFIAALIPKWIPWPLVLAYSTGAAFILAAAAIVTRILARTAAFLLGLMLLAWVAVLHGPRIYAALSNGAEWNSGLVALGIAGCAFALCGSTAVRKGIQRF
jgi:uncharacterized membrane protein